MEIQKKARLVQKLYQNKDFQELILEDFITDGIHSIVMTENVESRATQDALKARQILHSWLYDIIQTAEIAKTEK